MSPNSIYTKESDGTIQRWYIHSWFGPRFLVTTSKTYRYADYHRFYDINDLGIEYFGTRKEAEKAEPKFYKY